MSPITFAHRGGAPDRRENTLEAFRHARDAGAEGLESDVRLSADGHPVLSHGARVRRAVRWRRIDRATAGELSDLAVPTLADLYRDVGTDLHVSLDLKTADAGPVAIETARAAADGVLERLWLCSPDLEVLRELRRREPDVRLVHSTARDAVEDSMERHAALLAEARVDAVNLHRTEWSTGLVVLFHRFDMLAFGWDAQEVRHLRGLLSYGVDAVYSDHVDRMVATVAEWSQHPQRS